MSHTLENFNTTDNIMIILARRVKYSCRIQEACLKHHRCCFCFPLSFLFLLVLVEILFRLFVMVNSFSIIFGHPIYLCIVIAYHITLWMNFILSTQPILEIDFIKKNSCLIKALKSLWTPLLYGIDNTQITLNLSHNNRFMPRSHFEHCARFLKLIPGLLPKVLLQVKSALVTEATCKITVLLIKFQNKLMIGK